MARFTHRVRLGVLTFAIAATCGMALTACTAEPDDATTSPTSTSGTQTVAEACTAVQESVQDAAASLQRLDPSDPGASLDAMNDVADSLADAAGAVDNADVAAILPELQEGFSTAADTLGAIAGGDLSRLPALQDAATAIQDSLQDLTTLCSRS